MSTIFIPEGNEKLMPSPERKEYSCRVYHSRDDVESIYPMLITQFVQMNKRVNVEIDPKTVWIQVRKAFESYYDYIGTHATYEITVRGLEVDTSDEYAVVA